jgi:hypothetical protein
VEVFGKAVALHGAPASLLCDNGAVFTATPRGGKVLLQTELERLGIAAKSSRPYHPPDLRQGRAPAPDPQALPGETGFRPNAGRAPGPARCLVHYYNTIRPHRALGGRTPLQAYSTRIKARPGRSAEPSTNFRVRHDKVDAQGTVTLRHKSKLHHIGIGRAHKSRPVKLLIADRDVRVIALDTGELIRQLTLDPTRDYQPIGGG